MATSVSLSSVVTPIDQLPSVADKGNKGEGFGKVLTDLVEKVSDQQHVADSAMQDFVTGKTDNIQHVVVSMAKADLSFKMAMEIRNQLIDSYRDIMRMQV